MRRFYVKQDFHVGESVELSPEEAAHALKVLRLNVGDLVIVLNGSGKIATARIQSAQDGKVIIQIDSLETAPTRTPIFLLQAILKGPKMDWLIEKATELGVQGIQPVLTERTIAKAEKMDRWKRILSAAMKQSGNAIEPELFSPLPLERALELHSSALRIFLQPSAKDGLAAIIAAHPGEKVLLAIGPEGGFTREEEELFQRFGFSPAGLSQQVLRGETAAIAAISIAAHSIDFCSS